MVKIRIFKEADATQVSKLIRKTLLSTNSQDYPQSTLKPLHDYFTPTKVKILASERYCLVAEDNGKIVGTGALEEGELKTIFVEAKLQRQGIGRQLVSALEKKAQKDGLKSVQVPSSITGASFYAKLGYKKIRSFMSKNAGQQIWMKKKL